VIVRTQTACIRRFEPFQRYFGHSSHLAILTRKLYINAPVRPDLFVPHGRPAHPRRPPKARAPAFEYLGTLRAETGTRTVVENVPQGTPTIVQVVGRFEGTRVFGIAQTAQVGPGTVTLVSWLPGVLSIRGPKTEIRFIPAYRRLLGGRWRERSPRPASSTKTGN
jgi:hypothetical protein